MREFCLSFHAAYACRHAGRCCTAGWPIAAGKPLQMALAAGVVTGPAHEPLLAGRGEERVLAERDGACVFYERHQGGLCAVHRQAGPQLLPEACRTFPRVSLRDPRGLFVTLSHFCPTAAGLLLDGTGIDIVAAPASLTLAGTVEGLDARDVMPPLLRPGMLVDFEGYAEWERQGLITLATPGCTADAALGVIEAATAQAVRWTPADGRLSRRIADAFASARAAAPVRAAAPGPVDDGLKRFLAAHLFASWSAYQDGGITGVVAALHRARDLFDAAWRRQSSAGSERERFIAAVQATDFAVRHTVPDERA